MCKILSNEEAIKLLKEIASGREDAIEQGYLPIVSKYYDAFDMAIKSLEQEPVLDKIRAEIDSALSEELPNDVRTQISDVGIGLEIALKIIDKHRKEVEE